MANDDLISRVRRVYAAVGAVEEKDVTKFLPQPINDAHRVGFYQDWSGGLSGEEIENIAHSLIHNIANLRDHLRKWAAANGRDKSQVDTVFKNSLALQVIKDLSNNDKHGYPPRNGGHSGRAPRIVRIRRMMRLKTQAREGSFVGLSFTAQGVPAVSGDGAAKVIISGDVVDRDDNYLGEFYDMALEAVKAWETLLQDFGLQA
jgi:hypothetical protein